MLHVEGANPWLSMWSQPQKTIRLLLQTDPKYGLFSLATIYTLQNIFFFANWWSLGTSFSFDLIVFGGVALSPLIGWIWLYVAAWFLYLTGKPLRGVSSQAHLRTAVAWSRIPNSLGLGMWFLLLMVYPHTVFVQDVGGPSSVFINGISLILGIWSFVLLVQSLREVQRYSLGKAFLNIFLAWLSYLIFLFLLFNLLRYIYLILF